MCNCIYLDFKISKKWRHKLKQPFYFLGYRLSKGIHKTSLYQFTADITIPGHIGLNLQNQAYSNKP